MAQMTVATLIGEDRGRDSATAEWSWQSDAAGSIDFLSPEFEAATGLAPQSLLGRFLCDLAGTGPTISDAQRAALAAAKPFRALLIEHRQPDGSAIWLEFAGNPMFNKGAFCGYCGIARTIGAPAEESLTVQRYRQLLDVASDWFWETDVTNRLTYLSPNVEAVLGLPVSAYVGKRVADTEGVMIEPEAGRASLAAIKARRPYRDFIYARKVPDGRTVWVNSSGVPVYSEDGVFRGFRGVARDVTAQVEAEQALRASEQRFPQMFELASDFYWELDAKFRYVYVSPRSEALHEIPLEEMRGKRLIELPGVSITPDMGKMVLVAQKTKQPFRDFVYSRKLETGETRSFTTCGMPIFDEAGEFQGYHGVGTDITARIEAELAAGLAQQRLHDAVNYVSQPLVVYDAADRAIAFNSAFVNLHRRSDGKFAVFQGVAFAELAEWQLQSGFYQPIADQPPIDFDTLLARHLTEDEYSYHLGDGRWMLVTYRQLPGAGRVGLWTDISAVKEAEAERLALETQLQESRRLEALGTLAGGAAHEINNALIPVLALTKLVARKLPEGSRERRNLDTVMNGAERARELVSQILAFSRKHEQRPQESVDIGMVLQEALQRMRTDMPASISLEEMIVPTPTIPGDPSQLHQVIVNVLANAVQAIGQALGSIVVSLQPEADGTHLRLSVADTGCGMDEATLTRVFEPFFTTKPVGEGAGLGLSMAHGIIKAHGGLIEVKSAPGKGSRFDIVLPVSATASTMQAA
jgi:PAS domain S-box-containing protein